MTAAPMKEPVIFANTRGKSEDWPQKVSVSDE